MTDKEKQKEVYFRIKGPPADLFERCREEAKKRPEYWQFAQLSRADFGRFLLMKSLIKLGKDLGLIDPSSHLSDTTEQPDE